MANFEVINGIKRLVATCDLQSLYDYKSTPEYISVPRWLLEREIRRVLEEALVAGGNIPELTCDCMYAIDADVQAHDRDMMAKALDMQTASMQFDTDLAALQAHPDFIPATKKPLLDRLVQEFVAEKTKSDKHMQKYLDPLREELVALNKFMETHNSPP